MTLEPPEDYMNKHRIQLTVVPFCESADHLAPPLHTWFIWVIRHVRRRFVPGSSGSSVAGTVDPIQSTNNMSVSRRPRAPETKEILRNSKGPLFAIVFRRPSAFVWLPLVPQVWQVLVPTRPTMLGNVCRS